MMYIYYVLIETTKPIDKAHFENVNLSNKIKNFVKTEIC